MDRCVHEQRAEPPPTAASPSPPHTAPRMSRLPLASSLSGRTLPLKPSSLCSLAEREEDFRASEKTGVEANSLKLIHALKYRILFACGFVNCWTCVLRWDQLD